MTNFSLLSFSYLSFPSLFIFPANAVAWRVLKDDVKFPKVPEPQLGHVLFWVTFGSVLGDKEYGPMK